MMGLWDGMAGRHVHLSTGNPALSLAFPILSGSAWLMSKCKTVVYLACKSGERLEMRLVDYRFSIS
jgi:hypothetical protein